MVTMREFIQTKPTKIRRTILARTCLHCATVHGILGKCIALVTTKARSSA